MLNSKLKMTSTYLIFTALSVFDLLVLCISNLWLAGLSLAPYIAEFFGNITSALLPLLGAAVIFAKKKSFFGSLLPLAALSLPRIIYTLPYFYLSMLRSGADTPGAISFAILFSLGMVIIFALEMALYNLIMRIACKYISSQDKGAPKEFFNLGNSATVAVLLAAAARFLFSFIGKIIDTVSYLLDYSGDYMGADIIFIVSEFLFILGVMLLSHIVTVIYIKHLCRTAED